MGRFFRSDRILIWIWVLVLLAFFAISFGLVMDTSAYEMVDTSVDTSAENRAGDEADQESSELENSENVSFETDVLTLVSVSDHITTITAADTSGFKAVILSLIGPYEMLTKDYTYQSSQGYTSHSIETESDYAWLCSAAIFIIVVYCFLRILGGVICGRK